ncbi:MAG: terminase large subunit domain-containing protein, partial [Candidatus Methylomirabilis sp.]
APIYSEGLARIAVNNGMCMLTFTPLLGMTEVVNYFYPEPTTRRRAIVQMGIEDALHIPPERRQQVIDAYPAHEREARIHGIPMLGTGRVFPIEEARLKEEPLEKIPAHWPRIGGLDFGWDHPFAAVALAWDRDADCLHVTHSYAVREETPVIHCAAIKSFGRIPFAWPHDGHVHEGGVPIAAQYQAQGILMLPTHATLPDGSYPMLSRLEASVMELLDRMKTGRFKVASHLQNWWEEFRHYHRKDGKIVKKKDDLLSATRMAVMMLRYARDSGGQQAMPISVGLDYDPLNPSPTRVIYGAFSPQDYQDSYDPLQ